jgi:hypothetical protein
MLIRLPSAVVTPMRTPCSRGDTRLVISAPSVEKIRLLVAVLSGSCGDGALSGGNAADISAASAGSIAGCQARGSPRRRFARARSVDLLLFM